ncbi:hypothetical protein NMG60_11035908 [Bertholletia excelsa]
MLTAQAPFSAATEQMDRPKTDRKPLQPRNSAANVPINYRFNSSPKTNLKWIDASLADDSNKENRRLSHTKPAKIESFDASLAEELDAIRQKLERQRIDRNKTEMMLRKKDLVLDTKFEELIKRGEVQKQLEIEVDRLFRLKELKSLCVRTSPVRSLREKEQSRKEDQSQDRDSKDTSESSLLQSPRSQIHTEK